MEQIYYTVDIANLLSQQEKATEELVAQNLKRAQEGLENKKELLKHVLPFLHGIFALHNNKCNLAGKSSTGRMGLLGLRKIDIQQELDFYVQTDSHIVWQNNFQTFKFSNGEREVLIWLNRPGAFVYSHHLPYSMTTFIKESGNIYGKSVEDELSKVARYCARYTDNW